MMIERAEAAGIRVVSANTDGVLFWCPRSKYAGINKDRLNPSAIADVTDAWEKMTGYDLEFGEYDAIYNASVNSYYAIKPNGGHKRKGPIGNPWNKHPDDFDPVRGQLMKNPQATICSDAALEHIKHGTPIEETIRSCLDITQFVTVIKASKGATWNPTVAWIEASGDDDEEEASISGGKYLGKTIRYYWGVNGAPIFESVPNPKTGNFKKIPKTDGAIECMRLPDELPQDIDYDKYIAEANSILWDVGFYGPKPVIVKPLRVSKVNRPKFNLIWSAVT
jgi:hypothetical protein